MALQLCDKKAVIKSMIPCRMIASITHHNIDNIYDLFINNKIGEVNEFEDYNLYGIYYIFLANNRELGIKYFIDGIEKGCWRCMSNIKTYYGEVDKNFELSKKYYIMCINEDHDIPFLNYLRKTQRKMNGVIEDLFDEICIKVNNIDTILCICEEAKEEGYYKCMYYMCHNGYKYTHDTQFIEILIKYYKQKENYEKIEELVVKYGVCINIYLKYCQKNNKYDGVFELHKKHVLNDDQITTYLNMLNEKNKIDETILSFIADLDISNMGNLNNTLISLKKLLNYNLNLMDLHFKYSVNGTGYNEAKDDFIKYIAENDK